MKTPEKSRFGKLVAYLLDPQGKKTRVGEVTITNCVSTDTTWAVREIAATQRLNARAKSDRTYHLLISLRAGENPDAKTLRVIEERFCKELGYAEHQRVSVIHHDTDNVHIHVAINKIHPKTLTLHDPVRDYKKRSKLCAILEHELGLAQDNHQRGQTRGNDVTPKSGQESFQHGFSDTLKDSSMRQVGRSFMAFATLMVSGWSCAQTALSLLIGARSSASKRARLIAVSGRRRWKLALALLFLPSTNRGGKNKGTRRGLASGASILRGFGKNTRRSANCIKHCARPSWRAWQSIEPNRSRRLRPLRAPSAR